jgi:hypothetical protein
MPSELDCSLSSLPCAGQEEGGGEEQPGAVAAPTLPTYRGGGPAWDNPSGGNRGAGRGGRVPLRYGKRGRWGRW